MDQSTRLHVLEDLNLYHTVVRSLYVAGLYSLDIKMVTLLMLLITVNLPLAVDAIVLLRR
jgi:hypothetical protein